MLTFEKDFGGRANTPQARTTHTSQIFRANARGDNLYTEHPPESSRTRHWMILLRALKQGPVTTLLAREELGVQAVAQRIMDLRLMGYCITTRHLWQEDAARRRHRIAQYVLHGGAE